MQNQKDEPSVERPGQEPSAHDLRILQYGAGLLIIVAGFSSLPALIEALGI